MARLELLILIRLASVTRLGRRTLCEQLRELSGVDDFDQAFEHALRALVAGQWITARPFGITAAGRARAAEALGVRKLPAWRLVKARHLPALALGIGATQASDLVSAVVAQVLVRLFGLSPRSTDPAAVIMEAVSKVMKVDLEDEAALQTALVRSWIAERAALLPNDPPRLPPPVPPSTTWTDDEVIAAVRSATARVPAAGRFGGSRVFVSAVWRQLGEGAAFPGLTLDGLKTRLVVANRRQQLTLARADLVGAMDPREVATSEIRYLNSTFHFVLDRSRP